MAEVKKSTKSILKQWKKCQELSSDEFAKLLDEEVAANVSRLIWKTAHLEPQEQAERFAKTGHCFHWIVLADSWLVADAANRILHDEEALKRLLCSGLPADTSDDADYLAKSIHHAKYIHFQMTKVFNGGFDAYVVLRITETARVIVVRLCR